MVFRNINFRLIGQILAYVIYLLVTFIFMVNNLTFWLNFVFVTFAFLITFGTFLGIRKINSLAFIPKLDKILFFYYVFEISFATLLYIIMAIIHFTGNVVPGFFGFFHLIQIPVTLVVALLIVRLFILNKYIGNQIKEERATVSNQRRLAASINMSYANGYDYRIIDRLQTLQSKCRGIGLATNPNVALIEDDISVAVNVLNGMLIERNQPEAVIRQIQKIEALLERRREINRRY